MTISHLIYTFIRLLTCSSLNFRHFRCQICFAWLLLEAPKPTCRPHHLHMRTWRPLKGHRCTLLVIRWHQATCVSVYMFMCVYVCVCVYVCMCAHVRMWLVNTLPLPVVGQPQPVLDTPRTSYWNRCGFPSAYQGCPCGSQSCRRGRTLRQ